MKHSDTIVLTYLISKCNFLYLCEKGGVDPSNSNVWDCIKWLCFDWHLNIFLVVFNICISTVLLRGSSLRERPGPPNWIKGVWRERGRRVAFSSLSSTITIVIIMKIVIINIKMITTLSYQLSPPNWINNWWVFMVFHGSRWIFLIFIVPGWFSWFFMVPGWFFMVPGWFFMVFLQMYLPQLYPGPTIQSRSAARRAA